MGIIKSGEWRLAATGAGRLKTPRPAATSALVHPVRRRALGKGALCLYLELEATRAAATRSWPISKAESGV